VSLAITPVKLIGFVMLAFVLGLFASKVFMNSAPQAEGEAEQVPLYWVAPMDPNYRRDKPGKSPMGMDLVPVYAEAGKQMDSPGLITISPRIENSLGVSTDLVAVRKLSSVIPATGYIRFNEHNLIHIHPRVSGWVEKLYVKADGDPVEKGAALYALYSPELVNAQEEYILALSRENPRLVKATENRLKALQISPEFIQELRQTQNIQQSVTFFSPQQGFVDHLAIREGYFVQPGTTMFSIASLKSVWLDVETSKSYAADLQVGAELEVNVDFSPTRTWRAAIEYVYPVIDETTRSVRARALIENPDEALKPNMYARVNITPRNESSYLSVANEAIIRTAQHDRVVMALGQGRYKSVEVKVGKRSDNYSEILEGLHEGERVVTSAQFLLDSESSKQSDFDRIDQDEDDVAQWAIVDGLIHSIDLDAGLANISRGPIEKWNRGPARMDFLVDQNLIQSMKVDDNIRFKFEIRDGEFRIVELLSEQPQHSTQHSDHEAHDHD
jgi:Cu(I)/Ag(I) efflux system membrane fusion protein